MASLARYSLVFYAPPAAVAACKAAVFRAGAGRYPGPGNYTECCWSAAGTGQFRPGDAANPHIGSVGALEETPEVRVETLCVGSDVARKAVEALKSYVSLLLTSVAAEGGSSVCPSAHPYEEPAYQVHKLEDF
ncbi:Structural toxin protein RtxA [Tolypocladium paradoxum]|uniref:ATP phosphoribosyltransferase n=1 Tax=Tolypocladium paradoxum TaxID=94208 RepID=A0A2S4LB80_9HYPO|nr:Structural toxin protein RtxA [Tolypocladium paradoxum]